jgi:hypothetical protein
MWSDQEHRFRLGMQDAASLAGMARTHPISRTLKSATGGGSTLRGGIDQTCMAWLEANGQYSSTLRARCGPVTRCSEHVLADAVGHEDFDENKVLEQDICERLAKLSQSVVSDSTTKKPVGRMACIYDTCCRFSS